MADVQILRVDGRRESHELPRRGLLQAIYGLIGCEVGDVVNLRDGRVMLVDDTGLVDGKPINRGATSLYHAIYDTPNPIAGDVAIVLDEELPDGEEEAEPAGRDAAQRAGREPKVLDAEAPRQEAGGAHRRARCADRLAQSVSLGRSCTNPNAPRKERVARRPKP